MLLWARLIAQQILTYSVNFNMFGWQLDGSDESRPPETVIELEHVLLVAKKQLIKHLLALAGDLS